MSMKILKRINKDNNTREETCKGKAAKRLRFKGILNWFLLIFAAVIAGYSVVTFMFQTIHVTGPSMNDTLVEGQVVLVNKITYRFSDVERYDIIAFSQVERDEYYEIKRVIGLPGETVLIKDGFVYIDGNKLEDLPLQERILIAGMAGEEIKLSDEEYFVLGDNVNNSEDSRYANIGNISKSEILGKVTYILSPNSARGKIK